MNLTKLDISHNQLNMIPAEISACTSLVSLFANNNKLTCFPTPWDCPLVGLLPLPEHVYAIYFAVKIDNIRMKNFDNFLSFA